MLFSDLEKKVGGKVYLNMDCEVNKFSVDTRSIVGRKDEVFIALKGQHQDGHDFIRHALEKGVSNFIVERETVIENANVLLVSDSLRAFQEIASQHRQKFKYPIIAITGSNGKTTIKEWLSTILSQKLFVIKSPKSFNSQIGVPISILEMGKDHEVGVFEAGISQEGEMKKLERIIQPDIGILSTIGEAHDTGFSSLEEKVEEKLDLFQHAKKLICRSDVDWFPQVADRLKHIEIISWSLGENSNYKVKWSGEAINVNDDTFQVRFQDKTGMENITHSIIASLSLGLDQKEIQAGLNLISQIPMRLELKRGINDCFILDDTYNNDLVGLKMALDYLDGHRQNTAKTLILSDILHSSKLDAELYTEINDLLIEKGFTRFVGIGKRIKEQSEQFSLRTEFFNSTAEFLQNPPPFNSEMILIKGARSFELEKVVQTLEEKVHGTVLSVNFEALQHNLNQYRKVLKSDTKLMVMVKANAYGSGLLEVANFLQHQKVDQLGVAYVDEAIQLRKNGITLPIMIMNPYIESFKQFEKYRLQPEIFSTNHLKRFIADSEEFMPIHVKIDTGMHRLGFSEQDLPDLIGILGEHPEIKVASIFTHFSSSDDPSNDDFTRNQAELFNKIYNKIVDVLGYQPTKHACNSPAMIRWPAYHFDMVRLGIGLHGFDPTGTLDLRPASQLKSIVSQIQSLKKGDTVGYSRKGELTKDSQIAVIPLGYEDGYLRVFGNGNATMKVNGVACPTVGNVCMDMTMIDVTNANAQEGDEVIVFGERPTIQELAAASNTIPYEILTNVSSRVKRVFLSE